ncbi:unnamed protein product [Cylicocyclus nassatus]|uniref:Uncharacterized protein n=1 Tax=Cylicocyclus nassatus TaxID=53992 RepID=A0AA36DU27_CYLNA|nr:unnamed protein product [Cylicocyclus nassatus]
MIGRNHFVGGVIQSDYVMNQFNEAETREDEALKVTQPETRSPLPQLNPPSSIPSQYMDLDLRSFITVNQNRNYQDYPSTICRKPLVGHPISADEIRRRADALDNSVYSPVIVNGTLYFLNLEDDTRTAKSSISLEDNSTTSATSASNVDLSDVTFTLEELKGLLPQYAIKRLTNYHKDHPERKKCNVTDYDLMKLQDAISTIARFTQNTSHPAVEEVKPSDPDFAYLRGALNLVRSEPVPQPTTETTKPTTASTTTITYTDAYTKQSVTGNPTSEQSSTLSSVPFVGVAEHDIAEQLAASNAETSVDMDVPISKNITDAIPTIITATVPSSTSKTETGNQIFDNITVSEADKTKPELLTEWERLSEYTAKDHNELQTPVLSWSTDTAHSFNNDKIQKTSTEDKKLNGEKTESNQNVALRMDSPERDVYTAVTIAD